MGVVTNVQVYTDKLDKKFAKIQKEIQNKAELTVTELVDFGRIYAKRLTPKDTGKTASLISGKVLPSIKGAKGVITAGNPTANRVLLPNSKATVVPFNLVRWMHTAPRANGYFYSGSPHFMQLTRNKLNEMKKSVATGFYRHININ